VASRSVWIGVTAAKYERPLSCRDENLGRESLVSRDDRCFWSACGREFERDELPIQVGRREIDFVPAVADLGDAVARFANRPPSMERCPESAEPRGRRAPVRCGTIKKRNY
jgi:hypothetical protein